MIGALEWLARQDQETQREFAEALNQDERNELDFHWHFQTRTEQVAPKGDWRNWLILAGRGFGKTRAGAEWVREVAERHEDDHHILYSGSLRTIEGGAHNFSAELRSSKSLLEEDLAPRTSPLPAGRHFAARDAVCQPLDTHGKRRWTALIWS